MEENALHHISYGIYIISSIKEGAMNGQIANALIQVTNVPATVAISINKKNLTHDYIESSSVFSVSILEKSAPLRLIGRFGFKSGRQEDKFKGMDFQTLQSGCPVVMGNTLSYVGARVINKMDAGTYTLFLGEVTESKVLKTGEVMTYDYYHLEKGGITPDTAPTFIKGEDRNDVDAARFKCAVCGYIYNPAYGDPDGGIAPGTPFKDIPADWACPICGAGKDKFVLVT